MIDFKGIEFGLLTIFYGILITFLIPLFSSSCGGRDACGNRWCLVGILDQYYPLVMIGGVLIIMIGIIKIILGVL